MGKPAKTTGTRVASTAKAGKKSGSYIEPPAPNPENKKRREAGRQQFVAKAQLTRPAVKTVFNKKTFKFEDKIYDETVPFIWDEDRGNFVYSPGREEG